QVAAVVDRCLQKSPSSRVASARDIAYALRDRVSAAPAPSRFLTMWRVHQSLTMLLYVGAGWAGGGVKKLFKPNSLLLSIVVACGVGAAAAGVMRGHLLFTSRMNAAHLSAERRRLRPLLVVLDLAMAAGCALAGLTLASLKPLNGVLTVGLAAGLALAT